jgi:hypothetical protein
MDDLDKECQNIDVTDVYEKEKTQILKTQGNMFPFTLGDYVVKVLLGPIETIYDELDEIKLTQSQYLEYTGITNHETLKKQQVDNCCILL